MQNQSNVRISDINIHKSATTEYREYSLEEISQHNKRGDAWIIINERIFDVSKVIEFKKKMRFY